VLFLGVFFLTVALLTTSATAVVVNINPAKDNTIYEDYLDNSCGSGSWVFIGITSDGFSRRALIQFDIAGNIPAGSIINSVTLTMNSDRTPDNQNAPATLHRVQEPTQPPDGTGADWGEGSSNCDSVRNGGQGIAAASGDTTWPDRSFNSDQWRTAVTMIRQVPRQASLPQEMLYGTAQPMPPWLLT
jgi:hypothetical protein